MSLVLALAALSPGQAAEPTATRSERVLEEIPSQAPYKAFHALVIGIDAYAGSDAPPSLHSAVADARAIGDVLADRFGAQVISRFDEDATLDGIEAAIADLGAAAGPADAVVVYWAGHGHDDDTVRSLGRRGFLVPYDGTRGSREGLRRRYEMRTFVHHLDQVLRAKHVLVVVDTCFSGRVVAPSDVETTLPPLPTSAEVDRRARRHSFEILTAGRADEPVLDTAAEGSHSVLASTLLAELARIDEPAFVVQLVPEVQQRVANASRALRRPQTPAYHQLQRSDPGALVLVPGARYPQEGVRRAKGSRQLTPLAERRGFPWLTAVSGAVAIAGATTGAALLVARGQTQAELQSFGIATRTESRDEVERLEDVERRQGWGAAASLVVGGIGAAGFVIGLRAEL